MKRKTLAALPLVVCAAFGSTVMAEVITFKGEVLANTCIPDVNGDGKNATIKLDVITEQQLPNIGDTAGDKPFSIHLTKCSGSATKLAKTYFWQAGAVNGRVVKEPGSTGSGTGWEYQILPATGENSITVGQGSGIIPSYSDNDPGVPANADPGELKYRVRYYRAAAALNPGELEGKVNYVIFSN